MKENKISKLVHRTFVNWILLCALFHYNCKFHYKMYRWHIFPFVCSNDRYLPQSVPYSSKCNVTVPANTLQVVILPPGCSLILQPSGSRCLDHWFCKNMFIVITESLLQTLYAIKFIKNMAKVRTLFNFRMIHSYQTRRESKAFPRPKPRAPLRGRTASGFPLGPTAPQEIPRQRGPSGGP